MPLPTKYRKLQSKHQYSNYVVRQHTGLACLPRQGVEYDFASPLHKTCVFEDFEILFDLTEKPSKMKKTLDFEIWMVPRQTT